MINAKEARLKNLEYLNGTFSLIEKFILDAVKNGFTYVDIDILLSTKDIVLIHKYLLELGYIVYIENISYSGEYSINDVGLYVIKLSW